MPNLQPEALTTLENLKDALDMTGDSSQDDRLKGIINRISAWLENQTHRKLKARNYNGENENSGSNFSGTSIPSEDYLFFDGDCHQVNERGYGVLYLPVPVVRPSVSGALTFQLAVLSSRAAGADGSGDTWDTTELTEGDDYVVDYKAGKVTLLAGVFTTGFRNYRVKCTAGYYEATAPAKVPEDLEQLCSDLCKQMYQESRNVQSETIGSWSRTYKPDPDPITRDTISLYTLQSL